LPGRNTVHGAVQFRALSVAQAVPQLPRQEGDPGQDELWLITGDQLLGSVKRASRHALEWQMRSTVRTYNWSRVRGIYFKQVPPLNLPAPSERVRVWLRSGLGGEPDNVVGEVSALDGKQLILQHRVLGKITISRTRLHRLRLEPGPGK
jgi:hypothetical protein